MPEGKAEDAFGDKEVSSIEPSEKSGVHQMESRNVELVIGEKYKMRVEMVHSSRLKFKNPHTATLRQVLTPSLHQYMADVK